MTLAYSTPSFISETRLPLFWAKVLRHGEGDCWPWNAYRNQDGYGYYFANRFMAAHRIAYMLTVGPIPDGLQLDHLCRNRACCNPAHLEPVTARENCLRGETVAARNAAKTHCSNGHPYAGDNLITKRHGRACRICKNLSDKFGMRRKRAAARCTP